MPERLVFGRKRLFGAGRSPPSHRIGSGIPDILRNFVETT
jgi:hypothetical protein